jgi:hypothetical protein
MVELTCLQEIRLELEYYDSNQDQVFEFTTTGTLELTLKGFKFEFEDLTTIFLKFRDFTVFAVDKSQSKQIYT